MSYVTTPMIFYILNYINEIWRKTKVGIFVSLDMFCKLYYNICPCSLSWFMNFNFHWSDWIWIFIDEIESSDFIEGVRSGIRPYFTCQIPRFQIIRQIQLKYILNLKNMLLKSTLLKRTLSKNTVFRNTLLKNTLLKNTLLKKKYTFSEILIQMSVKNSEYRTNPIEIYPEPGETRPI